MIYIKNTTETQTIFIPRNELQKEAYITSTKTYEDGYREGLEDGKEYQKDQLLNLYVTENGQYEREDGWGVVTVDMSIPDCSGAYDEGYNQGYEDGQNSVECPEGGSCNLGEGEIYLTANDAGFYELYAAEDGYDGWSKFYVTLENGGAIKIHKAEELIQGFWGVDLGAYYYVGGKITDIQEVSMEWGNATYTLDNGFSVYRGKWFDGNTFSDENQIKVGAYIVVYGIIQDYNGVLGFKVNSQVIAYQECEGGEIVSCNLEDKWVTPSMGDRDDNGYVVTYPSEGFDGLSRVVLDPTTIYNEGVTAGKAEGGDLTIGTGDIYLSVNERGQRFDILPSEWDYDAFDKFIVELENFDLGDTNIYDALSVNQLLMDGNISYGNVYIFKGEITEIQRIRPEYGDARYTLDGSLNVYNGQTMGYDLQVGDNVIVIGTLSEYNGAPQLSAGSMIKAWWREGGSGNCDDAYNSGYNQGFADATSFDKIAMEIETDVVSKLEFLTDRSFVTTSGNNSPKSLMFDMPINYIWSYRDVTDGIAQLKQNAFRDYSSIRKVKLNTIMTLGERAFKDALNLQEIDMSNLIGYIATEAVDGCSKLAKIICRATGGVVLGSEPFNGLPENGVLYLQEGVDETPWLAVLPNGWTVERL